MKEKLQNFPSVHFISIQESENRRSVLYDQFEKYGITKIIPHVFEKYNPNNYEIETTEWWAKDKEGYLGCTTSHLSAIKEWYDTTDESYAFFCEDDISFDSVDYWNFTWEEFVNRLPTNWGSIQLVLFRNEMFKFFQPEVHVRNRCWCDGSTTGYLITREHAKNLLDHYYVDGKKFILKYQGVDIGIRDEWATYPTPEALMFSIFDRGVYAFPLFVENPNFDTTVWDLSEEVPQFHWPCYTAIMDWWRERGMNMNIDDFFGRV